MSNMGRRTPQETGADRFGRHLRELRKSRNLTQAQLAKKLGGNPAMVCNYERGVHYPPVPTLIKMAEALDVSVDRLLGVEHSQAEQIQDRGLLELFMKADRADFAKQGLVKQVVASLLRGTPANGRRRTGTNG